LDESFGNQCVEEGFPLVLDRREVDGCDIYPLSEQ